jgi:hypothetical protein
LVWSSSIPMCMRRPVAVAGERQSRAHNWVKRSFNF